MNENMKVILDKIKEYDKILIFRHFRPDGDAIGSTKGLQRILQLTFPEKKIYLQNNDFWKSRGKIVAEKKEWWHEPPLLSWG